MLSLIESQLSQSGSAETAESQKEYRIPLYKLPFICQDYIYV